MNSYFDQRGQTVQVQYNIINGSLSDDKKENLESLLKQLNGLLAQIPAEKKEDAEAVAVTAEDLVSKATAEKPNKTLVSISSKGLLEAATTVGKMVPTLLPVVKQIVEFVAKP